MNSTLSTEMNASSTAEIHVAASPKCTHENTRKSRKFGGKCAICRGRVWKFWKTRKCLDCKSVVHRSCLAAREHEDARKSTVDPTEATEATAVAISTGRSAGYERDAPMYVTPTQWLWTNVTAVTIDCRRRPTAVTVVVNHGGELSVAMFAGLFDLLPVRRRRTPVRPSTPASAREVDLVKAGPTLPPPPPRHRPRSVDRCADTREAGDAGQTTRPSDGTVDRVWRETDL